MELLSRTTRFLYFILFSLLLDITLRFFGVSISCNRNVTTSFHCQNSIIRKVVFTLKVVFFPSAYISLWTAVCHWIQKHRFTVKNRSSLEKCSLLSNDIDKERRFSQHRNTSFFCSWKIFVSPKIVSLVLDNT